PPRYRRWGGGPLRSGPRTGIRIHDSFNGDTPFLRFRGWLQEWAARCSMRAHTVIGASSYPFTSLAKSLVPTAADSAAASGAAPPLCGSAASEAGSAAV